MRKKPEQMPWERLKKMRGVEVAKFFGVSAPAVTQWAAAGCPRNPNRTYDLMAVARWRLERIEEERALVSSNSEAGERYRMAKAELAELDLAQRRGGVVPVDQVKADQVARILVLKQSLLGLPNRLAAVLAVAADPRDCKALLDDALKGLIRTFAGQQ